jgi:predicted NUDIX family NTP pyrophosphohydrolase
MSKQSAGVLMYRRRDGRVEVFLVHPGGPFWTKKDFGAWSIPKGEYGEDEQPIAAAVREFTEETGFVIEGNLQKLGAVKQAGGKVVTAWYVEGDCDPDAVRSNSFAMEWPPRSGRTAEFPEVDRARWFTLASAREYLLKSQLPFLDMLDGLLGQKV